MRAPSVLRALALLPLITALACNESETVDPVDDEVRIAAYGRSNGTLGASLNLARAAEIFRVNPFVATLTEEAAQFFAVEALGATLNLLLQGTSCEYELTTTLDTVELTFPACEFFGYMTIDGTLSAQVEIITEPCEGAECPNPIIPSEAVWNLSIGDLVLATPRGGTALRGNVELRSPLKVGSEMSWDTGENFEFESEGVLVGIDSVADFRTQSGCVKMDVDSEFVIETSDDALELEAGDLAVFAEGIQRCSNDCPSAGDVFLAYGSGEVLNWQYSESPDLDLVSPGGRRIPVGCEERLSN